VTAVLAKTAGAQSGDMTVYKGQQVMLSCSGSSVSWYLDKDGTQARLFSSPGTWYTDKGTKYDVVDNYNLVVKDVQARSDGGRYLCYVDQASEPTVGADLVVVGNIMSVTVLHTVQYS